MTDLTKIDIRPYLSILSPHSSLTYTHRFVHPIVNHCCEEGVEMGFGRMEVP